MKRLHINTEGPLLERKVHLKLTSRSVLLERMSTRESRLEFSHKEAQKAKKSAEPIELFALFVAIKNPWPFG
jgi:hypothetical protein